MPNYFIRSRLESLGSSNSKKRNLGDERATKKKGRIQEYIYICNMLNVEIEFK